MVGEGRVLSVWNGVGGAGVFLMQHSDWTERPSHPGGSLAWLAWIYEGKVKTAQDLTSETESMVHFSQQDI
jgi:hypothetical protein